MNIELLNGGGSTLNERFEVAFQKSGLKPSGKRKIRDVFENYFVQNRLWMPIYVAPEQDYGERWKGLFELISNTEDHQTIIIAKGQFFPTLKPETLHKRWYVLPSKRWDPNRRPVVSAREALEERMASYTLDRITQLKDIAIALDFQGIGKDGDYRITTPFDWLRARALYDAFGSTLDVKIREGDENLSHLFAQGVLVEAKGIPSLSGEKKPPHDVVLRNVAAYEQRTGPSDRAKIISYGLRTSDDCDRHTYTGEKFYRFMNPAFGESRRTGEETDIDHHTGLILLAAEHAMPRQRPGLQLYNPLPETPKGVEELVDVAYKRIMVTEGKNERRFMLWEYVGLMKIYTMMAAAYLNTQRLSEERKPAKATAA